MRIYVILGSLFIVLVIVASVIISKDGIYRSELESGLLQNSNFELLDEVSLDPESDGGPELSKSELAASLISAVKEKTLKEKVPESANGSTPSPENSKTKLSSPEPQEITESEQQGGDSYETILPEPVSTPPPPVFPVDINTAGLEDLQKITGVGPVIAQRIIEDRAQREPFYYIHDIRRVNGIGDATFEKMRYQITVGNVVPPPSPPPPSSPPPPPPADNSNPTPTETPTTPAKININTAGAEELEGITGVGPVIAGRVIDYRNQNGPFQNIEDIKNVSGIGDVTFEKMKDEITI